MKAKTVSPVFIFYFAGEQSPPLRQTLKKFEQTKVPACGVPLFKNQSPFPVWHFYFINLPCEEPNTKVIYRANAD
ncbi:hypothetical protein CHL9752_07825 [Campylobacter hyointestinalis subsp. lawsonii]|nr:hypothetical protein CHL9752_07825 [Campylobacter hyointestinalis subsp. lawsonii]